MLSLSRTVALFALLIVFYYCCLFAGHHGIVDALKADTPTCRDEDGNPIDWFIAYKFPLINEQSKPFNTGAGYAYVSSGQFGGGNNNLPYGPEVIEDDDAFLEHFKQLLNEHLGVPLEASSGQLGQASWTVAKYPIDHEHSMIMRSLAPVYEGTRANNLNWIFYNDHPAKSIDADSESKTPSKARAHAKGTLLMDDKSGDAMWLTHTVPRFPPPVGDQLTFSDNAYRHGQTFMCLNYDAKIDGDKVVRHLANMFALIYNSNVSPKLRQMIPELEQLRLENERTGLSKGGRLASLDQIITTRGGQQFELFSKSSNLAGDMYAEWLADELDSSLYVESWRQGFGDPLDSDCPRDRFQVNNIQSLQLLNSSNRKLFSWPYTKDHSKWAISETQEDGVVCLADINRMASQFKRGGGAVCLKDPKVWTVFSNTIEEVEPCKYKTKASKKKNKSKNGSRLSNQSPSLRKEFVEKIKQLLH